jgi:glycosyltransferase involved in cell wall biosynthesis
MRALDLVFVAPKASPAVGGMESYLDHLTQALARRHRVTVLALTTDGGPRSVLADTRRPRFEPFEQDGVRVVPLRPSGPRRALLAPLAAEAAPGLRRYAYGRARLVAARLYAGALASAIAAEARTADVVHMWGGDVLGAAALRAARSLGAPLVQTPFAHRGQWGDDPASAATYRAADRIVALLEAEADVYRDLGAGRVTVVPVCSPGVPAGGGAELRQRLGLAGPLVLFLGVRRPYKGYDLLLRAAELAPSVTFAFAGPGPRLERPGANVLDVGEVDADGRAAWLDASDLLCLPSQGEIFPGSFLEAWSVGTPVLASDIPTLRELVTTAGAGAVAPRTPSATASTLLDLLSDAGRLRSLGEAGRRYWAERCTPEAVAAAHERLYASLPSAGEVAA